jgi:hypothetical protein
MLEEDWIRRMGKEVDDGCAAEREGLEGRADGGRERLGQVEHEVERRGLSDRPESVEDAEDLECVQLRREDAVLAKKPMWIE